MLNDDRYTEDILKERFTIHLQYHNKMKETSIKCGMNFRNSGIPEDISENIIKFIIRKYENDKTCKWNRVKDLLSIKGILECKCFTSEGPISFSPTSEWDSIYFLDGRNWCNKIFKLYKFPYKTTSEQWKKIKVSKKDTFEKQSKQCRRPRIGWTNLYEQIFDGVLEDIIKMN